FGALPEEEVVLLYHRKKAKFDEAIAREIMVPSLERKNPACQFFGLCGGCSLQHLSQPGQITYKEGVLLEQLEHFGNVVPKEVLPPLFADPYGYRRKARYSVRYVEKKQKMLLGFRELYHPRFLADIDSCQVLHPNLSKLIAPLQSFLSGLENRKHLAQIEAAVGDNATALVIRHLEPMSINDRENLEKFAEDHAIWLYLQPKGYDSIHRIWPTHGDEQLTYKLIDDITLFFEPTDFTQVNTAVNRLMIKQAITLLSLDASDVVLDLFCGLGNFSLPIAQRCQKVFGVEGEKNMVQRAALNASKNNIKNAVFSCADLNKDEAVSLLPNANKVLIDPPRSGAEAVVKNLSFKLVEALLYVSCNPATLARDAGLLQQR
ncbi:MAG TPA: 23S rRNA (uracil(1939)-C(5))-methyltransferase RlmD, partial [Myxococcota bacterium]|nr:23S rRNA (uracil(1939)-C(5))-methyltransferase RlmD [Myxococcota bacterium]